MKRIISTIAALAATLAFMPITAAHAEDPFSCNGSPEIPDTYFCIVRFEVGVDPTVEQVPVVVPAQEVESPPRTVEAGGDEVELVPSTTVTVPEQGAHVPIVCLGVFLFCVGPFDPSTPEISVTTPAVSADVPMISQTTPGFSESTPAASTQIPVLGVEIPPGAILVVWYKGACTYVFPDGSTAKAKSASPSTCP